MNKEKLIKKIKRIFNNRKRIVIFVLLILFLGFLAWKTLGKQEQKTQIQTAIAEKGNIVSSVSASGQILTSNITHITTQASGVVKKVYVTDGDQVSVGQPIAEITLDIEGQQNQTQAYASYLSAKSSLASAEANYYTLQSDLFAKNQKFINDAVARELVEDDPTYIQQNADWLAAEAKFNNSQTDVDKAKASFSSAWFTYQQTRAIIASPTAGKIHSLTLAEGITLSSVEGASGGRSNQRAASIISEGNPLATFNVSEIDVSLIKPGQKTTITIDSIADKTFTGKVVSVDKIGTTTSGVTNYPVIIQLDTSSDQILPNMAATASIIIESKSDVLLVPSSAIQAQNDQSTVKTLKNSQEQIIPVEIGLSSDTQIEIISGLSEGDEVITGTLSTGQTSQGEVSPFSGFGGAGRIFR